MYQVVVISSCHIISHNIKNFKCTKKIKWNIYKGIYYCDISDGSHCYTF